MFREIEEERPNGKPNRGAKTLQTVRRAFAEFLFVPTGIIVAFLLLAIGLYYLDFINIGPLNPIHKFLRSHVFTNAEATSSLLGAISAGIITMTSITISLLLIAVQQASGSMTSQVFDQFLRRRLNQIYFGFFIGLALYSLVTLATVTEEFNPVFGATLALTGTVVALYLLLLLLYTTINQMRPGEIIDTIHNHILIARERQLRFIRRTRPAPLYHGIAVAPIRAETHGFVTRINIDAIGAEIDKIQGEAEVVLLVSIGSFVAFQDVVAEVNAQTLEEATRVGEVVLSAVKLERRRDITIDAADGIEQLETIAWTSISTAKSNPSPGRLTIFSLRDVLSRWSIESDEKNDETPLPIVYKDNTFGLLIDALETFAVVSSESMQHQNYIEVLRTFTVMFDRLPPDQQERAEDLILRILSALGDHVLTSELNTALSDLTAKLKSSERFETAAAVQKAWEKLKLSVGKLNSRSTRVASSKALQETDEIEPEGDTA